MTKFTISQYLAYLFNRCVEKGIYPNLLKVAQVVPIYKNKGSKANVPTTDRLVCSAQLIKF